MLEFVILKMIKLAFNLTARLKLIENSKISIEVLIVDYVNIIKSKNVYKNLKTVSRSKPSDILIDNTEQPLAIEPQIKENESINKDESVDANVIKTPSAKEDIALSSNPLDGISTDITIDAIKASWNDIISYLLSILLILPPFYISLLMN